MAIHIVNKQLMPIKSDGTILSGDYTIQEKITSTSQERIIYNSDVPNSIGNPSVNDYLISENADGFALVHIDQTYVITQDNVMHDLIDAGRLKVDASGVVLTADIVEADMEQVTGEAPTSATLYDLETQLTSLVGTDFATQTTLAAVLAKLSADPATQTTLAALSNANGGQSASASSGTAAGATTDNTAVTLISADASQDYHHVRVINEGSTNGFFSPDGGTTWHRLPAFTVIEMDLLISNSAIQIKRVSGGDNLSDVYASVW